MNKFINNVWSRINMFLLGLSSSVGMLFVALVALTAPKSVYNKVWDMFVDVMKTADDNKGYEESFKEITHLK